MVVLDLAAREPREVMPGWQAHFVHSAHMTFAHWTVAPGARLPAHSHPHEQVANVIDGELELTVDGETCVLRGGMVAVIPPHAVHSGRALTPCHVIDAFYPIREDYR